MGVEELPQERLRVDRPLPPLEAGHRVRRPASSATLALASAHQEAAARRLHGRRVEGPHKLGVEGAALGGETRLRLSKERDGVALLVRICRGGQPQLRVRERYLL